MSSNKRSRDWSCSAGIRFQVGLPSQSVNWPSNDEFASWLL